MARNVADTMLAGRLRKAEADGYITLDSELSRLAEQAYNTESNYRDYRSFHLNDVVPGNTAWTRAQRAHNIEEALEGKRPAEWTLLPNEYPTVDESNARVDILDAARRRAAAQLETAVMYDDLKPMLDGAWDKFVIEAVNVDPDTTPLRAFIEAKTQAAQARADLLELNAVFAGVEVQDPTVRNSLAKAYSDDPTKLPDYRTAMGMKVPAQHLTYIPSPDETASDEADLEESFLDQKRRPDEPSNRHYMTEAQIERAQVRELEAKEPKVTRKPSTKAKASEKVLAGSPS